MKNFVSLGILVIMGFMLVGCSTTTTSSSTKISADGGALLCGAMVSASLISDDRVKTSITSVRSTADPSDPVVGSDGWWYSTYSYGGATWYTYFLAKDSSNSNISSSSSLSSSTINNLSIYANVSTVVGSDTVTITLGSGRTSPLIFDGLLATTKTINGPMSLAGTTDGTNYCISMTYSNIEVTTSGYPVTGSVSFTVTEGSATTLAGVVTFDEGNNYALLSYTTGSASSYRVNLDTGGTVPN